MRKHGKQPRRTLYVEVAYSEVSLNCIYRGESEGEGAVFLVESHLNKSREKSKCGFLQKSLFLRTIEQNLGYR